MNPNKELVAKDILKTQGIVYFHKEAKLAEAMAQFESSHDAEIIVNDESQLLGIITPYYSMIKRKYPPETKLKTCLYHPPKIKLTTPLSEVARLMLENKVHYLPVVDDNSVVLGIVTARRMLDSMLKDHRSGAEIEKVVSNKKYLQTINLDSELEEAIRFFEQTKLSKLVVLDKEGDLKGILSFFDIVSLMSDPKERIGSFKYGAKPKKQKKYRVNDFLKTSTIQVNLKTTIHEVISLILSREIGSVIVMKKGQKPLNIITTSDLLRYFF